MKNAREDIDTKIATEETQRDEIRKEIEVLKQRLEVIDESLAKSYKVKEEFDKSIGEVDGALSKIVESS